MLWGRCLLGICLGGIGSYYMDINVVVPFYNRSTYFDRLIKSIESQTVLPTEVFIIDNGSDFKEIESIIPLIENSKLNITLASTVERYNGNAARNLGLYLSKDVYVAFLDSDDWWDKEHLEKSIKVLEESNAYCVYSPPIILTHEGKTKGKSIDVNKLISPFHIFFGGKNYWAQTSSYVIKKNKHCLNIYWDEALPRHQDYDFFLSIANSDLDLAYSNDHTTYIDWSDNKGRVIDFNKQLPFIKKWESKFPKECLLNYLKVEIYIRTKVKDEYALKILRDMFLQQAPSCSDRVMVLSAIIHAKILIVRILEFVHLKKVVKKLFVR